MTDRRRLEAVVHGLVQGVGFRWYIRQVARRLALRGYVRNRPDRTVEVIAEGPERSLLDLLSSLQTGPSGAIVQRVDTAWLPESAKYNGFEVRF
jgi:acylphosphatase